jgi:archaellum component FlaD/FlaE
MASLEARLDRAKTLHARRVEEKRREVAKARNQAAKIAARNEEIMAKVAEMDAATRDVAKLRRVSDATRGGGGSAAATDNAAAAKEKKMRALVTQSKLQHIAKTQAEEMAALREELERARLRTFPSFVERTDRVRLPDIPDARRRR